MRPGAKPAWRRRGVALIIATLTLLVFGPMVGLAIDVGILYLLKSKMSQAADAACLAGARSLSRGADIGSQRANAIAVTGRYFDVNFPSGYWATDSLVREIAVTESGYRERLVTVNARVNAPLYFLRLLRKEWAELRVSAQARRRDVNVMMILDRSGSLETAGACGAVRSASRAFVDRFANGRDRIGMISFNGGYNLDYAPSLYFKDTPSVYSRIDAIRCGGWTGMSQALWQGYQQLVQLDERGALNVILFFTDGRPTALTALYPVKKVSDQRYGDGYSPYPSTAATYTMAKSTCFDGALPNSNPAWNPADKLGFVAANNFDLTGSTVGLLRHNVNAVTEPVIADSGGCAFATRQQSERRDIAYLPDQDYYQNSTRNELYKQARVFPTGHPYAGRIRTDSPLALRHAAYNATDSAAYRIRSNADLNIVIYVVGLGGTGGAEPPDGELMLRVANDGNPPLQPDRPKGLYVYSPTTEELNNAFLRVASEILRLAI